MSATNQGQNDLAVCGDEPTFDADGYPTEDTEQTITQWPRHDGYHALLGYVARGWKYPAYFRNDGNEYRLSTAGWSGNEQLIRALRRNIAFWAICWWSSARGGHYVFTVPARSVGRGTEKSLAAPDSQKSLEEHRSI